MKCTLGNEFEARWKCRDGMKHSNPGYRWQTARRICAVSPYNHMLLRRLVVQRQKQGFLVRVHRIFAQ